MLLAAILATSTFAVANIGEGQGSCEIRIAETLELSGDEPSEVADAAITACSQLAQQAGASSLLRQLPPDEREKLENMRNAIERKRLSLAIIRLRACRKSKGCVPNQPLASFYEIAPGR